MIQANELRIGNWVDFNGEKARISQLWEMEAIFKCGDSALYSELKPIPLTGEILLKAGGKRFDEDKIILMLNDPSTHLVLMKVGTHWFPQIEQTGEFASEGVNVVFLNFIDYLHQLQNLFFALTGEEIKIEL